jgi:N-acetylglucosaminyldiphosphoundecaprenol N-acetyl-beta-D-mannosaminyltransferase
MSAQCSPAVATPGPVVETSSFLGVNIAMVTSNGLLDLVSECIRSQRRVVIAHHNLHSLCLHSSSSGDAALLRRFYDEVEYTVADGMSMIILGRLQGHKLGRRHRVAYNDWLPVLLPMAVRFGWRVFYLGSTVDVADKGAAILRMRFPGLQLDAHHGHFDADRDSNETRHVLATIARFRPNILFVGMGVPRQERWIQDNRRNIEANVILTSGATLDYIAGAKQMAPRWMGNLGLEWAFRLATEPRRLAFRYLVEPWGLISAILTNDIHTSRDSPSSLQLDGN